MLSITLDLNYYAEINFLELGLIKDIEYIETMPNRLKIYKLINNRISINKTIHIELSRKYSSKNNDTDKEYDRNQ